MSDFRLHLVTPAFNEEANLPKVMEALNCLPITFQNKIVVDNASTDATAEVARSFGATVLRESQRGYGAACLCAVNYLEEKGLDENDIVVFLDADFSDYPEDLPKLLEPIELGEADFVVGSRLRGLNSREAVPVVARLGNSFAMSVLWLFYRFRFTDMGPFRAISWPGLKYLAMADRTWGWTLEMQLKAVHYGLNCAEVPVRYRERYSGKSKISQSFIGAVRAGSKILFVLGRYLLLSRPPKQKFVRRSSDGLHRQAANR